MKPRNPTEEEREWWEQMEGTKMCIIAPMIGHHVGAGDIMALHHKMNDGTYYIRVPWVVDERDVIQGLREGLVVWSAFRGGMLPTDMVLV